MIGPLALIRGVGVGVARAQPQALCGQERHEDFETTTRRCADIAVAIARKRDQVLEVGREHRRSQERAPRYELALDPEVPAAARLGIEIAVSELWIEELEEGGRLEARTVA